MKVPVPGLRNIFRHVVQIGRCSFGFLLHQIEAGLFIEQSLDQQCNAAAVVGPLASMTMCKPCSTCSRRWKKETPSREFAASDIPQGSTRFEETLSFPLTGFEVCVAAGDESERLNSEA